VVQARAQSTFSVTMEAQGDLLMMEADDNVVVLEYADAEDEALQFEGLENVLGFSVSDAPALLGCSLPALVGGGAASSDEGTPIEFDGGAAAASHRCAP
jgi:hypothetical protein